MYTYGILSGCCEIEKIRLKRLVSKTINIGHVLNLKLYTHVSIMVYKERHK